MPHINRVRVNNVKYNFGTQYYDDFVMRFSGKNTIYDLANGGGKSVLMLLLLQNMIPNCTLDEKQPIEKLFRTGNGSTTIHSLIEWRLSDIHVNNNYKYMLTGFCARKGKDVEDENVAKDTATIEYFNYVIFYRQFNDNDIKNLPLQNGDERITYNGLKNYLRELEKRDLSLDIHIFERKGEYQRFIAQYGIYESEWEIIRGINKTEGHVRTYFETNYKTTRKVVEDLLVEEIIQKSFNVKTGAPDNEDMMARTLMDIKDKLMELIKSKEDINNYDRQIEVVSDFIGRVNAVKELYYGRDNLVDEIIRCYHTIAKKLRDQNASLEDETEKIKTLTAALDVYRRDIDTVKIKEEEEKLKTVLQECDKTNALLDEYKEKLVAAEENLSIKESINDYADYIYYKEEREKITVLVDNILRDKGDIANELKVLAAAKYKENASRIDEINAEISREQDIVEKENELISNLDNEAVVDAKNIAVYEFLSNQYKEEMERIAADIKTKREQYQGVLSFDVQKDMEECSGVVEKLTEQVRKCEEDVLKTQSDIERMSVEKTALKSVAMENDEEISACIDKKEELSNYEKRMETLCNVYSEKDAKSLFGKLEFKTKEIGEEISTLSHEFIEKSEYYERLKEGKPIEYGKELEDIYNYIIRCHGNVAVKGADFINALSTEKKKLVLEKNPLIPYSIVIKSDYHTIMGDSRLVEHGSNKYAVPIVRFDSLKGDEALINQTDLNFVVCDEELFYDEEAREKALLKISEEMNTMSFRLDQLKESESLMKSDMEFVRRYVDEYQSLISETKEQYEKLREQRKGIEKTEASLLESLENAKSELVEMQQILSQKTDDMNMAVIKSEVVKDIVSLMNQYAEIETKHVQNESDYKKTVSKYESVNARRKAQKDQFENRKKRVTELKNILEDIKNKWDEVYKSYYREDISGVVNVSGSELDARFTGLKQAFESGNNDIKDKQKLIENYDMAMEKALLAIDYKGKRVDDIAAMYNESICAATSADELKEIKQSIKMIRDELAKITADANRLSNDISKMEGSIARGTKDLIEKFGQVSEVSLGGRTYKEFIDDKKHEIEMIDIQIKTASGNIKLIENMLSKYAMLKRDIDKIVQNAKIIVGDEEKLLSETSNMEEKIEQIVEKNDKFLKEMYDKRESFEKEKQMLAELLVSMNAVLLSEEIKANVNMPENVSEADKLGQSLSEICDCIALEKDRILKSIEDMEMIKDNFENQCIQTCLNIKTELDRLPKLSKINMDGETISMIGLTIPYIKEDQYKYSMQKYIDDIVATADDMRNEGERLKYIRTQLSFKKLFSVIVTDMNAIKLNLYKRERIKEQSRYLKYEEAVGSTGQSQGIYIQFLISIINYISSINSKGGDGMGLRKVVFIDNPFGAAKDIYIWEPIFKLLKTNNVQLVVPARGTTPAITGRFDVNYILGQKLIDGKAQTVVVDYMSNVDNGQMEYETLKYEQTVLF